MIHQTHLDAKIAGRNKVNNSAGKILSELFPLFTPYIGKKTYCQDGSLVARLANQVKDKIKSLETEFDIQIFRRSSKFSICYEIRSAECYQGRRAEDTFTTYQSVDIYVAELKDGKIKSVNSKPIQLRADFKAEDIFALRSQLTEAEDLVRNLQSQLCHFGTYDT